MAKISKIAEISEIRKTKDSGKEYKILFFGAYKDNDGIIKSPRPMCIWRDFDLYNIGDMVEIEA